MFKKLFFSHDWVLTSMVFLILTIGLTTLYSTSVGVSESQFQHQLVFAIVGVFIYFLFSLIDYSYLQYKPILAILYAIDSLLLLLEFIAGHTVRGATRWLSVGLVNLQPSEFTKIVIILSLASFLAFSKTKNDLNRFLLSLAIAGPLALLVFIEPSLSAASVLVATWGAVYFLADSKPGKLAIVSLLTLLGLNIGGAFFQPQILLPQIHSISIAVVLITFIIVLVTWVSKLINLKTVLIAFFIGMLIGFGLKYIVWNKVLHDYQKQRITAFTMQNLTSAQVASLDSQSQAALFQVKQSKIAIGSGEVFGKGFAQGTQSKLNFLPDHNTDFIFASFSEEFGLFGDGILLTLFVIMYFKMASIAEGTENKFGFLIVTGTLILLSFQTFVNIAINLGLLPATGVPMPLVSYGGSSLWITLTLLGIVQSVKRYSQNIKWQNIDL